MADGRFLGRGALLSNGDAWHGVVQRATLQTAFAVGRVFVTIDTSFFFVFFVFFVIVIIAIIINIIVIAHCLSRTDWLHLSSSARANS